MEIILHRNHVSPTALKGFECVKVGYVRDKWLVLCVNIQYEVSVLGSFLYKTLAGCYEGNYLLNYSTYEHEKSKI